MEPKPDILNFETDYSKRQYNFVLLRWFFNYGWVWVVGFILTWVNTLIVVYYLIPSVKTAITFRNFFILSSIFLVALSTFLGWLLIRVFKVQSIETKIATDINPYAHTKLTKKEIVFWNLMISTAEQLNELSKKHENMNNEKRELFEKKINRAKEFLSNRIIDQIKLGPHFDKDED